MAEPDDLGDLTCAERDAVQLVYFEGLSSDQAARVLRTDRATIGRSLTDALTRVAGRVMEGTGDPTGARTGPGGRSESWT